MRLPAPVLLTLVLSLAAVACGKRPDMSRVARGKVVYMTSCVSCHNPNPHENGSSGPPVWGSTRELLHARVVKAAYPPGYLPKRRTKLMIPLPHLEPDIDALYEFLSSR